MAIALPPEKSGWLGPEEHFTDTGLLTDDPGHLPTVKLPEPRVQYRPKEPENRSHVQDNEGLDPNSKQGRNSGAFQKIAPKTDPYVVGFVADKETVPRNGFVSYPVDAPEMRRDGSVVPNDKRRDAFVYQTSTPVDFEKIRASALEATPNLNVPIQDKCEVKGKGANNQIISQLRAKMTSCFGNREESKGSSYYIVVPKKPAEPVVQEPATVINADRYRIYENDTPTSRNSPVASPRSGPASFQNRVALNGPKASIENGANKIHSILKKPIEHLPHTHYPKLSNLLPKKTGNQNHGVSTTLGPEQKSLVIPDGQVYSSNSVRFGTADVGVGRAEVQATNVFVQASQRARPQESRQPRNWAGFVTYGSAGRSSSMSRQSSRAGKSPGRDRSKVRDKSPDQVTGRRQEAARPSRSRERVPQDGSQSRRRNKDMFNIEEIHSTYADHALHRKRIEKRSDLSSSAKQIIVSHLATPSGSRGRGLSRRTSESGLSTCSRKRKLRERKQPTRESVADDVFYGSVIRADTSITEDLNKRSDWTGLNRYQGRTDKFADSNNRLDLVNPDINEIRLAKVHKTFETTPLVYATRSTEEIGCPNAFCDTKQRDGSPGRREVEGDCFDEDGKRLSSREATGQPTSAKTHAIAREESMKVLFKRPPSIKKPDQERKINQMNNTVKTSSREQSPPENDHYSNRDMRFTTHFANDSFQASGLTHRRASLEAFDEEQRRAAEEMPTVEELTARFYTPATVLLAPGGQDDRFHDNPPANPRQQTKDTQTVFRDSSPGPQHIRKTQNFYNIIGPSSKARNSIDGRSSSRPPAGDGTPKRRPSPCNFRGRFDESQPYEHVYSDSVRVIPDFQSRLHVHGRNMNVNHCEASNRNFGNYASNRYESPNEYGDICRDNDENGSPDENECPGGYGSPDGYESPYEHGFPEGCGGPDGYGPDGYESPDGYGSPDEYRSPDGYPGGFGSPGGHENLAAHPPPRFVGKPLGQTNNNQVVEGAWDFVSNLFHKKKFRNAAYNKRAEVTCGDCGNGMRFTLSVGMQDSAGCLVCYNRIRDDFVELLNVYREKGYLPCECKSSMDVNKLVNGYLAQERLVCTCVGDAFIDLGN